MRTLIGMFIILAAIGVGIFSFFEIIPLFENAEQFTYWFVISAVVFITAAGVLVGALLIERDVNP